MTRRCSVVNAGAIWKPDDDSKVCDKCGVRFTFLYRRHHCRCCGNIYCHNCTHNFILYDTTRVRVVKNPESYWEYPPYRTCDTCFETLRSQNLISSKYHYEEIPDADSNEPDDTSTDIADSTAGTTTTDTTDTTNTDSSMNHDSHAYEMNHCPLCNQDLRTFPTEEDAQQHVERCITSAEQTQQHQEQESEEPPRCPTLQNRMLVYKIPTTTAPENEPQGYQECPICFEEMVPGEKVGRLECLCVYHYSCIKSWFRKKRKEMSVATARNFCPIHDAITL
ncbi:uncharacterized protein GVI51_H07227 [Nakaseomyces glabratus]|uniref:RING-type E3 ubiquitin transferase n=1 Tax=Candida glabrata (strain ATCC 2001 / BCRC 20586 / JCM 3761 / NBRC 0622 / NRRL Y-65 / CBS 138) TaxID=284593 RepID=Q6FRM9_CANGA|nr:uncharacterized protein CAGL0H07315g [Nakaseomyces glabratus]KAH7601546.1 Zinc finger RING-type profile [Nakaseomyces glabratus]KAH7605926.1 Zinc finger RING-type profile [Nakaseomyces glabratus]QHS66759.1 uncharacterized protein GVI51_H07227 [Nakaseomyces glabratus]CAG60048.2 unnamed protein product [Nakaseomyces glabratus]|eukprot:XP_447115.2 uncharacterized protein CAGL0H07315g [[Candida] glabrata]